MSPSTAEDRRQASNLITTLSGYVITAALAVLGAQAVVVTFVIDKRDQLTYFYVTSAVGTAALVLSIISGGKGIGEIAELGKDGDWKTSTEQKRFRLQARLALLGTAAVVGSAFLGHLSDSPKAAMLITPTAFAWFNHTWGRDDLRAFERDAFRHGHSRVSLARLYQAHVTVRHVLGVAS